MSRENISRIFNNEFIYRSTSGSIFRFFKQTRHLFIRYLIRPGYILHRNMLMMQHKSAKQFIIMIHDRNIRCWDFNKMLLVLSEPFKLSWKIFHFVVFLRPISGMTEGIVFPDINVENLWPWPCGPEGLEFGLVCFGYLFFVSRQRFWDVLGLYALL